MTTTVTDVRDIVPALEAGGAAEATRHAQFTREIVEAATARREPTPWSSAVRCVARAGRRACGQHIQVGPPEGGRVEWSCSACGARGAITGFVGTEFDMSPYVPARKKLRLWGFDDEARKVLLDATTHIPYLRAVIARASPARDVPGVLVLQATVDELDEIYTLVEQLTDGTRSRRRIELLDDLRAGLCTSMDGF